MKGFYQLTHTDGELNVDVDEYTILNIEQLKQKGTWCDDYTSHYYSYLITSVFYKTNLRIKIIYKFRYSEHEF